MTDTLVKPDDAESIDIPFSRFVPLAKVDEEKRLLYGWGSIEQGDAADEVMDYASSKPHFMQWVGGAQKRSGGKSFGNVRAMHQAIAAGKLVSFNADDTRKGFYVVAKIVDDSEWKKVQEGVYTGFSIGGSYVRRWPDRNNPGLTRYTARPAEISIVDNPCVPGATFDVIKGDGIVKQEFKPGEGTQVLPLDDPDEDLTKSIPGVPEPVITMAVGQPKRNPFGVEQLPNHITPLGVEPGKEPAQEQLQQAAIPSVDISAEIEKYRPVIQKMVEDQVAAAVDALKKELSAPAGEMIKVTKPRFIKVVNQGEENGKE